MFSITTTYYNGLKDTTIVKTSEELRFVENALINNPEVRKINRRYKMNIAEKEICDDILRDGEVIDKDSFVCDGISVEHFTVVLNGQEYLLTRHNGEWVYMLHTSTTL